MGRIWHATPGLANPHYHTTTPAATSTQLSHNVISSWHEVCMYLAHVPHMRDGYIINIILWGDISGHYQMKMVGIDLLSSFEFIPSTLSNSVASILHCLFNFNMCTHAYNYTTTATKIWMQWDSECRLLRISLAIQSGCMGKGSLLLQW